MIRFNTNEKTNKQEKKTTTTTKTKKLQRKNDDKVTQENLIKFYCSLE